MKHEQLLEGLLTAEEKEKAEEEAEMAELVGKVFAEKRKQLRRLEDTEVEASGWGSSVIIMYLIPAGSPTLQTASH